jgi:hypothetical protein
MRKQNTEIEKPPVTTPAIHEEMKKDRLSYLPEGESVQQYRDYCEGKHALQLTEDQKIILEGLTGNKFSDNLAAMICAQARDRLRFLRWDCKHAGVKERLASLYTRSGIKERQGKIHFDTLRDGNHAVAVVWNNEDRRVHVYRENWWNGEEGVFIGYGPNDKAVYAVKEWIITERDGTGKEKGTLKRRVVYYDDSIERWVSRDNGNSWEKFLLPGDEGVWPQPWKRTDETPIGIPIVHFRNSGQGESVYGSSEIAFGAIGMIDHIQDLHYVLSGAARMEGYQILWAAGIDPGNDKATGEPKKLKVAPGTLLHSKSTDFKMGAVGSGNPEGVLKIRKDKLQALSTMTRTPLHSITGGDWPSGEALLRAEQPAVGKAETQRDTLERVWAGVGHLAIVIENRFGTEAKLPEDVETATIEAVFAPVERRDALSVSVMLNNLGDILPKMEKYRLMGYTEDEAKKLLAEKDAEETQAIEKQNLLFSRGVGKGTELPGRGPGEDDEEEDKGPQGNNGGNNRGGSRSGGNGGGSRQRSQR